MDIQRIHKESSVVKPITDLGKSIQPSSDQQFQTVLDRQLVSKYPAGSSPTFPTNYQIRSGDTLSNIVKQQLDAFGIRYTTAQLYKQVHRVAAANRIENPNVIYVGQTIDLSSLQNGRESSNSISANSHPLPATTNKPISAQPSNSHGDTHSETHGHVHLTSYSPMPTLGHSINQHELDLPANGVLTSGFGMRNDPFTGESRFHNGIDIALPAGTPVISIAPGQVVFAGRKGGYGNVIEIEHPNGVRSMYAHLAALEVALGQTVNRGEAVGLSGSSGRTTGPHLHFEIRRDGVPIDPLEVMPIDTLPVGVDSAREEFGVS